MSWILRSISGARNLLHFQAEGDVLRDRQMREQRQMLEDHVRAPAIGRIGHHIAPADHDIAAARLLEAADDPQQGCLAATRSVPEGEKLSTLDVERDVVERGDLAKPLGHAADGHRRFGVDLRSTDAT
jgi:hypothetical protein